MFLNRPTIDKNVDMGLCYSIFQKCIRRCMLKEALYYGRLIYHYGTPNALRKRLIQSCIEDMSRLDIALELLESSNEKLLTYYLKIIVNNKKTRISEWYKEVCRDYIKFKMKPTNDEINEGIKICLLEKTKKHKEIKEYLGAEIYKLYMFMKKDSLVWIVKILWNNREELSYKLNLSIDKEIEGTKFEKIPSYVLDKHVKNGTKGYKFFLENGCVLNNKIYVNDRYEVEAKNIILYTENKKNIIDKQVPFELYQYKFRNILNVGNRSYIGIDFKTNKQYFMKEILKEDKSKIKFIEKLKKILKYPRLNTKVIKINNKLWLLSKVLTTEKVSFDEYFGRNRNMMLDQHKLIISSLFKSLVGVNNYSTNNYLVYRKNLKCKIYSINDNDSSFDNSIEIYSPDNQDINNGWIRYLTSFRKNKLIKKLRLWKKRIEKSNITNLEILVDRLTCILNIL